MPDLFSINRNALVIRPTREMIDWVNTIAPDDPVEYEEAILHDGLDIFLIPDFDSTEEALAWLEENFEDFLAYALEDWCDDETRWPAPLNWALFEKFLDYSIQGVVVDTVDEDDEDEDGFFFDDDFDEAEEEDDAPEGEPGSDEAAKN